MLRICRICLTNDLYNNFNKCYDDGGKIVAEIYALFQISIVSLADNPAIICRKCEKHILQARELQKRCYEAEKHFQEVLTNQRYIWNEDLREIKTLLKETNEVAIEKKSEDLNQDDLEDFMEGFDDLMKSLDTIGNESVIDLTSGSEKNAPAANSKTSAKKVKELIEDVSEVQVKIECVSLADTEILQENLDDRIATDFNELPDITQEEIMAMTAAIEDILPKEIKSVDVESVSDEIRLKPITPPTKALAKIKRKREKAKKKKEAKESEELAKKMCRMELKKTKSSKASSTKKSKKNKSNEASQAPLIATEKLPRKMPKRRESILLPSKHLKKKKREAAEDTGTSLRSSQRIREYLQIMK